MFEKIVYVLLDEVVKGYVLEREVVKNEYKEREMIRLVELVNDNGIVIKLEFVYVCEDRCEDYIELRVYDEIRKDEYEEFIYSKNDINIEMKVSLEEE